MCETVCVVLSAPSMRFEVKVFVCCCASMSEKSAFVSVCVLRERERERGTPIFGSETFVIGGSKQRK